MLGSELDAYWKIVVNKIQDGIMILDTDGTIIAANKALERMLGFSNGELIGKQCEVLNCNICQIVRKDSKEHWRALFEKRIVEECNWYDQTHGFKGRKETYTMHMGPCPYRPLPKV